MTAPLILLLFALTANLAGPSLLQRCSWVQGSPRWGIWAWQALSIAIATAVLLIPVTLAVPLLPVSSVVARLVQSTPFEITQHYDTPGGGWLALGALLVAVALLARVTALATLNVNRAARRRQIQLDALLLVAVPHPDGYLVVDHDTPLVYCLPGRRRQVVVTTGVVRRLSDHELDLVLAHERTHLRARHDLALALADALARTFSTMPCFQEAKAQISTLVEMQADDAARAQDDRQVLAGALVTLTAGGRPPESADHGHALALQRVRRLTAMALPMRVRETAAVGVATAVLLSAPIGLALAPAVEASLRDCCPTSGT